MSRTGRSDFKLPDLRIVPSGSLLPHEREDESRSGRLSERLRGSGVLKNPPVVTEARDQGGAACYVVLDGANRVSVARASDLPHFLVQVVRYEDPGVELSAWHHALSGIDPGELERHLGSIPGITLGHERIETARALLDRHEAVSYVVTGKEEVLALRGARTLAARSALLNSVLDVYRDRVPIYRVMRDSFAEARARFPNVTALVVYSRFEPREIIEIATSGARLPAGITRHVIPWRALRVNIALDLLADPNRSLEEKNLWLRTWLEERSEQKNIRFYEESTVLFDE